MTISSSNIGLTQSILEEGKINILLNDSTLVTLYPTIPNKEVIYKAYYYEPVNLRVSVRDSMPEFSWLSYDSEENGKLDAGIFHVLLKWGLTGEQVREAEDSLQQIIDSTAVIFGVVPLQQNDTNPWTIISHDSSGLDQVFLQDVNQNSKIPTSTGSKWAFSIKVQGNDFFKLQEYLRDETILANTDIIFNYESQKLLKQGLGLKSQPFELSIRADFLQLFGVQIQ